MMRPVKRPTSADVARAAGVSQTTVSFVLNNRPGQSIPEATRRRVLDAARELNYRPHASARALARGRSGIVLLSVPSLPIGASISRFVERLASALAEHDLTLVTHLEGAHGRPLPDVCASIGASAVVGFESFTAEMVEALHLAGADMVFPPTPRGGTAMHPVGRLQAEHLIGRGHRRLGFAFPAHPELQPMAEERLLGVKDGCMTAGIPMPLVLTVGLDVESASQAVAEWCDRSVTGICAFNDETAIAILAGMTGRGLNAPADMAVIGADDIPTARLSTPALTTIAFDLDGIARRRADAVVAGLTGAPAALAQDVMEPHLIHRSST